MQRLVQLVAVALAVSSAAAASDLWTLARAKARTHRFSTLFTAQNVRDYLSTEDGLNEAVEWCKGTGITKVYLETYRSRYRADRNALEKARDRFSKEGFGVAGSVSATQIGKTSNGWNLISCYTNQGTQAELRSILEYTALLFNEIMVDDYWFTDCTCDECDRARRDKLVRIRTKTFQVASDSWEDYRNELMVQLSRSHLLAAAREVNPKARVIVKFPQWYDRFRERGYDEVRQTQDFDGIWVGTETRDRDQRSGRLQYAAYFIMRWLSGIGGGKTGGGWFDALETTEKTYVEQARQTILAGAKESLLFSYGSLHQNFGPEDIAALRPVIPELLDVAAEVARRRPVGLAAYKPPGSDGEDERNVYDLIGMLGIPLAPVHEFPADAPALFVPIHGWKDPEVVPLLNRYLESGRPLLVTDGLARRASGKVQFGVDNAHVLKVSGAAADVLRMPQRQLEEIRAPLLKPFGVTFKGPANVGLYLFDDGSWVVENFNDRGVTVELNGNEVMLGARAWVYEWK